MRIKGFSPLFDALAKEPYNYSPSTSAVFGFIWRTADWSPMNKCDYSNEVIGERLNISASTVKRSKAQLLEDKLVKDVGIGPHGTTSLAPNFEVVMSLEMVGQNEPSDLEAGQSDPGVGQNDPGNRSERPTNNSKKEDVDILDGMMKYAGDYIPTFPEQVAENLNEFWRLYREAHPSLPPNFKLTKTMENDWKATGFEWLEAGFGVKHVRRGFARAQKDEVSISRPGSITYAMLATAKE